MVDLLLDARSDEVRINLAYVHHTIKNPLFEQKHRRGFHGRFGNMFHIPNYAGKQLAIGSPAGGSNGARWAKPLPHPQAIQVAKKSKPEIHGKKGKTASHAVADKWDDQFFSSRRGPYTLRQGFGNDKRYTLYDYNQLDDKGRPKEINVYDTLDEGKNAAETQLQKIGAKSLPTYKPPKDVKIDEPPGDDVTSVGMLIREPDGRIWIREPSNHFGGYTNSFPKGTVEPGESLQKAAHREVYEETGLKAKITGFLGDFEGDTSLTRMYIADRVGGEPTTNDETWAVKLVDPDDAHVLLNRDRDQQIIGAYSPDPEEKWLIKHYNGNEDRVATELLANSIYRALGVDVPKAGIISHEGRTALAYPAREGKLKSKISSSHELGKDFMADALVANWDVIGLEHDNVLWDKNKDPKAKEDHPIRLDQGGTLQYRAMGGTKDFGHTPTEVWSMLSSGGQAKGTMDVSPIEKRSQATRIYKTLTPDKIDDLVDQAPFANVEMKEQVRDALKGRVHWMGQFGKGMIDEKQDARIPTFEEQLQDDVESLFSLWELAALKDKVTQKVSSKDELFKKAKTTQQSFKFLLDHGVGVDADLDAYVYDGNFDAAVAGVQSRPNSYHVVIAPIKSDQAATEKVEGKYGGDWSRLTDVVRATVLVPHPANIPSALKAAKKHASDRGWKISMLESKMYIDKRMPNSTGPTAAGYRDLSIRFETLEGIQVELQFNWNDMFLAKQKNHVLYEEAREIERSANMHPTPAQQKTIDKLNAQMAAEYDRVWTKAMGIEAEILKKEHPDGTVENI